MAPDRFLIESTLPLKELSAEARREKAIRHGHISTLHVWWARRPLVVARAAVLGALLADDEEISPEFLKNLCRWEVHDGDSGGRYLLEQARALIRRRFGTTPPKVLDSFAGGGSIPLEALRLGAEAHALEYNPVAYLILKATIEYPQRYGHRLVSEVKRWGEWVLEQARRELAAFYPAVGSETPIAYIWSRTIRCPNPACGAEIPLFRQFWLARKDKKKVALKPIPNRTAKRVDFQIVGAHGGAPIPPDFDPAQGTVSRGNAVCLVCNTSVKDDYVKAEAQAGRMGHRLVAVVTTRGRGQGRNYRLATDADLAAFRKAEDALQALVQTPSPWPFDLPWVPEEPSPGTIGQGPSQRPSYGMTTWGRYFNPRQLLALCTFGKWVRAAHREILRQTHDPDFAKAVATYLALAIGNMQNYSCLLSGWDNRGETMWNTFSGHNLHMQWSYGEANSVSDATGSWKSSLERIVAVCQRESRIPQSGSAHLGSAAALPFPDKHFDAVVIDPPYADNVPYADLSDFFYVWLRRTVGDLYPEAFGTPLVPKDEEAVVNPARFGGKKQGERIAQAHYQRLMQQSFEEIYRVLKPEGMAVVMFTHRSTAAWESLIQSLLDAGLYPTASWPVHTEMEASTHQRGKGAIQSTILMACRRRPENAGVGWYAQVRAELEEVIPERLREFWSSGIRGADFFISAIGPAVGVFGKYQKVMRPDGREVTVSDLLDEARALVTRFALEQLGLAALDAPTRFYVLYRWAYGGGELAFDEANKLAKSTGAELDALQAEDRLIARRGQTVRLPIFVERLAENGRHFQRVLEDGKANQLNEVDWLHLALWFWQKGETEMLAEFLRLVGVSEGEHPFWRTAQAVLEVEKMQSNGALEKEIRALEQLLGSKRSVLQGVATRMQSAAQLKFQF
ncbi:MAG: DNA methylase [Anaerolineae bacterium]|nr:MAG: DNA methylase [Anaerolineae bacterium]